MFWNCVRASLINAWWRIVLLKRLRQSVLEGLGKGMMMSVFDRWNIRQPLSLKKKRKNSRCFPSLVIVQQIYGTNTAEQHHSGNACGCQWRQVICVFHFYMHYLIWFVCGLNILKSLWLKCFCLFNHFIWQKIIAMLLQCSLIHFVLIRKESIYIYDTFKYIINVCLFIYVLTISLDTSFCS